MNTSSSNTSIIDIVEQKNNFGSSAWAGSPAVPQNHTCLSPKKSAMLGLDIRCEYVLAKIAKHIGQNDADELLEQIGEKAINWGIRDGRNHKYDPPILFRGDRWLMSAYQYGWDGADMVILSSYEESTLGF